MRPLAKELAKEGDDLEELEKQKQEIDKDFEERNDGKFVLHMTQKNGGKWWVNRSVSSASPTAITSRVNRASFTYVV